MKGDYNLFDAPVRTAINLLDESLPADRYFITGGINIQMLIADRLSSRLNVGLERIRKLDGSNLFRKTGDIDVVFLGEISELTDLLFATSNFNYRGIPNSNQVVYTQEGDKGTLHINTYAKVTDDQIKRFEIPYRKRKISANGVTLLDTIGFKLSVGREKDIGDVERLIMVCGEEINQTLLAERVSARFDEFRAKAIMEKYSTIRSRYTKNETP